MNLPPIDVSDDKVALLPVKSRPSADEGAMLRAVPYDRCQHFNTSFEVDVDAGTCKCLKCGTTVTPIFVLERLMKQESRWMQTMAAYQDQMKRLAERSSTKCQHCGQMTRISNR